MGWQQITLAISAEDLNRAETLLRLAGARAVTLTDDGDDPVLEPPPGAIEVWPRIRLTALFDEPIDADRLGALLGGDVVTGQLDVRKLTDADWAQGLQQTVDPIRFGDRLRLVPASDAAPIAAPDVLKLNMGLAFGTGRHPTTHLCLDWIAAADLTGARVLDFGCGSGVLALAALKLGAAEAYATDNDEQALVATAANARLNALEGALWLGPPETVPALEMDILFANILAGTLQSLAGDFARCQPPGGRIVLSGVLSGQTNAVVDAFTHWYEHFDIAELDEWVRVTASRRR